ncbi:hypothetical protein QQ045_013096 [Rhodiola kirilowii]
MASVKHLQVFLIIFLSCVFSLPSAQSDLLHQECQCFQTTFQPRCVAMLSSSPDASKATDLKTLAIIGLELATENATNFISQVNAAAASNPELKPLFVLLSKVYDSFAKAQDEVKNNDIMLASYDAFNTRDYIQSCKEKLNQVKGTTDPSFETILAFLNDYALINSVIINDLNVS